MGHTPNRGVSGGAGTAARRFMMLGFLMLSLGGAARVHAATLYVRSTGSDTASGASPASAVRTIKHAAALANRNDRIIVGPGTYTEGDITPAAYSQVQFIADRRGMASGEAPGDVVIDATGFSTAFVLNGKLGVTIDGFVIYNAGIGIYVKTQSDQAVISNNIISNNTSNGIYVQDSARAVVFNNLVYHNGASGMRVAGDVNGSPAAQIVNNTVYANGNRGIFFAGTTLGSPGGLVINNVVQNNVVQDNTPVGIQVNASSRDGYLSAGNVSDTYASGGTPIDVTDVTGDPLLLDPLGPDLTLGGTGYADDDFHLKQVRAGQAVTSPAVNAGTDSARRFNLQLASTRSDGRGDFGFVDAGYHYHNFGRLPVRPQLRLRYAPLYVSASNGSDTNDGSTVANALQTLPHALLIARAGHRVILLGGTYRPAPMTTEITLANSGQPGRAIVLDGRSGATIDATGFSRGLLISGRSHVTVTGLQVTGASDSGIEVRLGSSDVTLRVCRLYQNGGRGLYINGVMGVVVQATAIDRNGSTGVQINDGEASITHCSIAANADQGLWAFSDSIVTVSDSTLVSNAKSGVLVEQSSATISDTRVTQNDDGVRFNASTGTLNRVTVSGNTGAGVQGISSSVSLSAGSVEGSGRVGVEAFVDPMSLGANDLAATGTRICNNDALGLSAQDTAVTLTDVTVCGNAGDGLRQSNGTLSIVRGTFTQNQARGVAALNVTECTLQDVQVSNNGDAGVQGLSSSVSIAGGEVEGNIRVGIECLIDAVSHGPAALGLTRTRVCNNQGFGVQTQNAAVQVSDVTVCANAQTGLRLSGGSAQVVRVTAAQNRGKGISVDGENQLLVQDATISGNSDNGLQIATTTSPAVSGCVVYANAGDGLTILDSNAAQLFNNLVFANTSTGILISGDTAGSPNAQVLNNTVFGNLNRGVLIGGNNMQPPSAGAVVMRNIFQGNSMAGLQVNELSLPGYVGDYNLNADPYGNLNLTPPGLHDVFTDAFLVPPTGPNDFDLSQRVAGQAATSPAVDAGDVDVVTAGLAGTTTRTDGVPDTGTVDLGYHYPP
jgi:parallel beta-helix repeat protein